MKNSNDINNYLNLKFHIFNALQKSPQVHKYVFILKCGLAEIYKEDKK